MYNEKKKAKNTKRYRAIKCENEFCSNTIDVEYAISVDDFDYVDGEVNKIYVYCDKCGLQHIYKL